MVMPINFSEEKTIDYTKSYTINGTLFQEFLGLLGKITALLTYIKGSPFGNPPKRSLNMFFASILYLAQQS
jgi:hypothetical protein